MIVSSYANEYFQYQLWNTDEGRSVGLGYLRQRGISDEMIRKFGLGYNSSGKGLQERVSSEDRIDHRERERTFRPIPRPGDVSRA